MRRKVKVLHVLEAMGGGTKKALYLLVINTNPADFDITLALPPPAPYTALRPLADPEFPDLMRLRGYRVETVDMVGGKLAPVVNLRALYILHSVIRKGKYDVVHAHSAIAGFLGRLAGRLAQVPVIVYTPEGLPFNEFISPLKRWLYTILERFTGLSTDALIACSDSEMTEVLQAKIIPPHKVVLIENCLDTDRYDITKIDVNAKKKELGLESDKPIVGTVARLTPQKGPRYFVDAAAEVLKAAPETQFVLVGDGELRDEVDILVGKLGISKNLSLLGTRKDYLEIMATFDVFVLSSLWEGMPYAPLEAMLLRKPIVATDITGCRDIIQGGNRDNLGILVPPKDPKALAEAILTLLSDKQLARNIGFKGEKSVRERFSIHSTVSRVTNLYSEILQRKFRSQ